MKFVKHLKNKILVDFYMQEKIGVGIVTFNRPELLVKLLKSIKYCNFVDLIVVNDGDPLEIKGYNWYLHNNKSNLGVGKSKNIAMKYLLDKGCDHIFIIEDDIFIKDENVFSKYIEASKKSGIQHFNYSQHGIMNKTFDEKQLPNPKITVSYDDECKIAFYPHCVGAFSYFSRQCLEKVGLIDEEYYNACEHVDHTYRIIQNNMHPPFWYFADLANSHELLGDEPWSLTKSTISSNPNHKQMISKAYDIFKKKFGVIPLEISLKTENDFKSSLKNIIKQWT